MEKTTLELQTAKKRSQLAMIWHRLTKNKLAVIGLIIIVTMIVASIAIGFTVDYNKIILHDLKNKLQGPSLSHWFGTDAYGRDLLYRIVYGARISLFIGFVSVAGAMIIGGAVGAVSGYYGGKIDIVVMRFMDMLMAIPSTLFAICVVSALGTGVMNLLLAIMVSMIPQFAMIVRSSVLTIKGSEFIRIQSRTFYRLQTAFQGTQDIANGNFLQFLRQHITAAGTPDALHKPGLLQHCHQLLQIPF